MGDTPQATAEYTDLVDDNGLVKLFANRVRARILATLFYADEPLSVERIADGANVTQSVVHEALPELERFGILEETGTEDLEPGERGAFALAEDDELTGAVRAVAELATERYYPE